MMNATKKKRLLGMGGASSNVTQANTKNYTLFSPEGKAGVTVTPDGVIIIHDERLLTVFDYFLPKGTKIIIGPHIDAVEMSEEKLQ